MAKTNVVNSKEVEASLMELFDACGEVSKTSDANGVTWNAFGNESGMNLDFTILYRDGRISICDNELGINKSFPDTQLDELKDYISSFGLQPVEAGSRFSDMPSNFTEDTVYYTYSFRGENSFRFDVGYENGIDAEIVWEKDAFMGSNFSTCGLRFSDTYGEWHQESIEVNDGVVVVSDDVVPKNCSVEDIEKIITDVHTLSMADCVEMIENPSFYANDEAEFLNDGLGRLIKDALQEDFDKFCQTHDSSASLDAIKERLIAEGLLSGKEHGDNTMDAGDENTPNVDCPAAEKPDFDMNDLDM